MNKNNFLIDIDDDDENETFNWEESNNKSILSKVNINIIKDKTNKKSVKITLQLNISLENKKKELINIDFIINNKTYLKIAKELMKK